MDEYRAELASVLRRVRARWRTFVLLRTWGAASTIAGMILALALLTNIFAYADGSLTVLLWAVAMLSAVLVSGILLVLAVIRVPDDDTIARFIEERRPDLEDALVTAVAEARRTPPHPMSATVIADAVQRVRDIDTRQLIPTQPMRIARMSAAVGTAILVLVVGLSARPAMHAVRVFLLYAFPARVSFEVQPGDANVRAGESVRFVARLVGATSDIAPVLHVIDGNGSIDTPMTAEAGRYTASMQHVERGFHYTVTAAGSHSREYAITVVRPPRVDRIDLRYEYPAAFHLQPRVEEDGGDIYAPAGTRVHLSIRADKPIAGGSIQVNGSGPIRLEPAGDHLEGELTVSAEGSYRVALADADGLNNPGDTEYFIRTIDDRPPDVRIVRPAADRQVSPIEEVPVDARADDDYGVASLELVYSVRGRGEKAVPFGDVKPGTTVNGTRTLYLEDLGVKPGDFVTYYARARDVSHGKRSTEARSDIFFLEVKPFDEEFVASQSQGSGAGGGDGTSLDELVNAQKDVITATWRLDRRARDAGGRSPDDIRAVARGQGEVRRRAAGIAAQQQRSVDVRRRRGAGGSQLPADEGSDQPLLKAMEAMAGAQEQLDALKTTEALPHEMTALNELLRAQAEIRRREVQRQQANGSGSGGSNRQAQDLSSLFDRELQRQQQTNYETPNSSETREPKSGNNDALDKIRELARRQEALNRDRDQLANNMSADDMRRQLERLTREQTELRQQAEELSRQLEQQQRSNQGSRSGQQSQQGRGGSQQRSGGPSGSPGSSSTQDEQTRRAIQQASEEMRNATSEMRRQNSGEARASGTRALDRLRDVEQRMRGTQPDARRRAAGELQLEARQLADAERQLASTASTSPRSGGSQPTSAEATAGSQGNGATSADDTRRRRAEQERLADRAQRLEEGVKQLERAEGTSVRNRAALSDAAREIDKEKLSERMRNAARRGQAGSTSDRNDLQELARALDRVGDRLASAGGDSDETRQLSEQLAKARELRDRLARVDQQLADARREGEQRGTPGSGKDSPAARGRESQAPGAGRAQGAKPGEPQQSAPATAGQPPAGQGAGSSTSGSWQEAQQLLDQLKRDQQLGFNADDQGFSPGKSAPGTEPWKQDFAKWDDLKKQAAAALEKLENTAAARLREQQAKDRLAAGAAQGVPDSYRSLVEQYYKALAERQKSKVENQK